MIRAFIIRLESVSEGLAYDLASLARELGLEPAPTLDRLLASARAADYGPVLERYDERAVEGARIAGEVKDRIWSLRARGLRLAFTTSLSTMVASRYLSREGVEFDAVVGRDLGLHEPERVRRAPM